MLWLLFTCVFVCVQAQYEVPEATVEAYTPRGFSVSIPDEEGIKLFAFHGKINEELEGREAGTFSRDILRAKDGRWTFTDGTTKLKVGDTINYWTYVEFFDGVRKLGYPRDFQQFVVKELVDRTSTSNPATPPQTPAPPTPTPAPVTRPTPASGECQISQTTFNNERKACKGELIFSKFGEKFWNIEHRYAGSPDYEFVIYVNRPETISMSITKGTVIMRPVLLEDIYGQGFVTKPLNLGDNCTGVLGSSECEYHPDAGFILPPVLSSRINTRNKFSFRYGKIEINAKLPKGDWIYPELYLNPVSEDYGLDYDSGQIRVAFTAGNEELRKILFGGVILGASPAARLYGMKNIEMPRSWANEYRRYGLTWKPDSITLSVDDRVYGTIYPPAGGFASLGSKLQIKNAERWKSGTPLAPFDKEMYITLGVGVGGFCFEDRSDGTKPWKNGARSSIKDFYKAQSQWASTWRGDRKLDIKYVKVWAL